MASPLGKVDSYLFQVDSFSFFSPVSAYADSKPIIYIKVTEDKNIISTPTFVYGSGKNILSFGSLATSAYPKIISGGFTAYSITSGSRGFRFGSSTGESGFSFEIFPKINTEHLSGAVTGNSHSQYKGKTVKNTMIEDVVDGVDELPDSYFSKAATILFDEIDNGKAVFLPSSDFVDLIETLWEGFHSDELAGRLQKVDPNESGILDCFTFVGWYVDEEVYLDSL